MPTKTLTKKKLIITPLLQDTDQSSGEYRTILFNCYCHTFEEVSKQIVRALRCSTEEADNVTFVADRTGSSTVCIGTKDYCEQVANILGKVGLNVTVIQ